MDMANNLNIGLEPVEISNDEFLDNLIKERELSDVIDEVIDLNKDVIKPQEVSELQKSSNSDSYLDNLLKERDVLLKQYLNHNDDKKMTLETKQEPKNLVSEEKSITEELLNMQSSSMSIEEVNNSDLNLILIQNQQQNMDDDIINKIQNNRDQVLKNTLSSDDSNRKEEIKKSEPELKPKTSQKSIQKSIQKSSRDQKKDQKQQNRISYENSTNFEEKGSNKKIIESSRSSNNTSNTNPPVNEAKTKYPEAFNKDPIWGMLIRITTDNSPSPNMKNIVTNYLKLLGQTNMNQFIIGITFALYSESLDNKSNIKNELIKSLIFLSNQFVKMIQQKIPIWNGKSTLGCMQVLNKFQLKPQA
jgi:hypothetical protein